MIESPKPPSTERTAHRWVLASLALCVVGLLACGTFGLTLCGGSGWPLVWGAPFLAAFGCALRADARHVGVALRTMRGAALLFAGFFTVVATGLTTLDFLSRPPSVDYTPPVASVPGAPPRSRPHRVARCSD